MEKRQKIVRLSQIKKNTLKILFQGKTYEIDLDQELMIDENLVNQSLRKSPSNYALLVMVRDRLIYKRDKLEKAKDQAYSKAWLYYKESGNVNNDAADHKAENNQAYQGALKRYMKAEYNASKMISICKAYESRENILRTISANIRVQDGFKR